MDYGDIVCRRVTMTVRVHDKIHTVKEEHNQLKSHRVYDESA